MGPLVRARDHLPFGLAALAAHAVAGAMIPAPEERPPRRLVVEDALSIEVVIAPSSRPSGRSAIVAAASVPVATPTAARRRASPRAIEADPDEAGPTGDDVAPDPPAVLPDGAEPVMPDRASPPLVAIDPDAAARAAPLDWGAPSVPGRSARGSSGRGAGEPGLDEPAVDEQALERALSADLRARAMTKAFGTGRRIELHARPDGSHVYRGDGFTATIRPDGTVEYRDADAASVDGVEARSYDAMGRVRDPNSPIPELAQSPGGLMATIEPPMVGATIGGTFDLEGELRRLGGEDPWAAERRQFLEETEELRAGLEDRHAMRERARALRRLPARLARIWAGSADAATRRRRIFEVWDGCGEDEAGIAARARIERWVREHLPAGSPDAYPDAELRALDAARESTASFAPYR